MLALFKNLGIMKSIEEGHFKTQVKKDSVVGLDDILYILYF